MKISFPWDTSRHFNVSWKVYSFKKWFRVRRNVWSRWCSWHSCREHSALHFIKAGATYFLLYCGGILALSCYFVLLCLTNVTWGRTRMLMTLISYVRRGEQIILYDWWQMTVLSNRILGTYGFFKESHALRLDYITAVYRVWPWKILIPADRDVTELLNNEGWKKVHTESE